MSGKHAAEDFPVRLEPPALASLAPGNTGVPGVWSFASPSPGPHTVIVSLVHGNEYAGALVLARLLSLGIAPARGRLSLIFANLDAFARFDRLPDRARRVDRHEPGQ